MFGTRHAQGRNEDVGHFEYSYWTEKNITQRIDIKKLPTILARQAPGETTNMHKEDAPEEKSLCIMFFAKTV
jgi:hypothetical protein